MNIRIITVILLIVAIIFLFSIDNSYAQVLPRHPPVIPEHTITPVATLLTDDYDMAYLAAIGAYQARYIGEKTGTLYTTTGPIVALLQSLSWSYLKGDGYGVQQSLDELQHYLLTLPEGMIKDLAINAEVAIPVCPQNITYQNASTIVERVSNPYVSPLYQDCETPSGIIVLKSPLDTIIALLTYRTTLAFGIVISNITIPTQRVLAVTLPSIASPEYIVEVIDIPSSIASKSLVKAIIQGKIQIQPPLQVQTVNETVIKELFKKIENGSKSEALSALQQLNEYAKKGLIPWSEYEQALKEYKKRFGTPILNPPSRQKVEEQQVNLTSFLESLQGLVIQAEKARVEVGEQKSLIKPPKIPTPGTPQSLPTGKLLIIAGLGLASIVLYSNRGQLEPASIILRVFTGRPCRGPEWCYKSLILILRIHGIRKSAYETPREFLERVRGRVNADVEALLEDLTIAYERKVYAEEKVEVDEESCISILRRALIHGV